MFRTKRDLEARAPSHCRKRIFDVLSIVLLEASSEAGILDKSRQADSNGSASESNCSSVCGSHSFSNPCVSLSSLHSNPSSLWNSQLIFHWLVSFPVVHFDHCQLVCCMLSFRSLSVDTYCDDYWGLVQLCWNEPRNRSAWMKLIIFFVSSFVSWIPSLPFPVSLLVYFRVNLLCSSNPLWLFFNKIFSRGSCWAPPVP